MKKNQKIFIRAVSFLMTVLLISGAFAFAVPNAQAATTTKKEKTYDIAVVFDNSGSMYGKGYPVTGIKSWSQAKYAMEIFASMLDFSKDRLVVFPMWKVTTDGSKTGGSYDGIEISSKDDIDNKINKMYTPRPWETPFEPVKEAEAYLKNSNANEKWLIVLTDGGFTQYKRNDKEITDIKDEKPDFDTRDYLLDIADEEIKVQYLGFGAATQLEPDISQNFYTNKDSKGNVQDDLINICNTIFQRFELDKDSFDMDDGELELDVSMQRIIVFAQGPDAKIGSLSGEEGDKVEPLFDSGQRKYSLVSAGDVTYEGTKYEYSKAEPDESLAGQVVIFGECAAGEYTLDCTGAKSVQIFYEPDIDILVEFLDSKNEPVKIENGEILEGEYKIRTSIIDRNTEANLLDDDHPGKKLLGDVELITSYKYSDEDDSKFKVYDEYHSGDKLKDADELPVVTLDPDRTINIDINGHYLDFDIKDNNKIDLSWLENIKIRVKVIPFDVHVEVLQKEAVYAHFPENEWEPIKVTFSLEGKPLTSEQFERVELSGAAINPDLENTCEKKADEKAYYFYIDQNKNPSKREPTGKYELTVQAVYTNEDGKKTDATEKVSFELKALQKWIPNVIRIIAILVVLTVITLWLLHPVLPKRVIISEGHFTKNATIRGSFKMPSRYDIRSVPVSGKAKVVPKIRNAWIMSILKPKRMNFKIVDVTCSGIGELTIDGVTYTAQNGKLYDSAGSEVKSMIICNSAVSWDENKGGLFDGTLNINRR